MEQGVEVVESGRSLRVQTDTPHLVSLGTGRLSTAVTLHPLTPGRLTIGGEQDVDIPLQGTGVEPVHCHIENIAGVVTLYPVADMTTVDGLKVTSPTRLTQGCMLCIGRSNYFRFNHPAEARLMKSILPTSRISTEAPGPLERKPPPAPRSRCSPRDSWEGDDCCVLGKVSRFELLAHQHLSPKVFPAGSPTANSPASAVLGPARSSPLYHGNVVLQNGVLRSRSATPTSALNGGCQSPVQTASTPRLSTPSPSFNRNPLPYSGGSAFRSVTPSPTPQSSSHRRVLSSGGGSDSLSCCSGGSLEELCSRSDELEMRRKQAQEARLREQEAEKQERARLEEILNMCAEYEMQAQSERQAATPHTPTLQQNRIKTNGSLPRDKRLLSPSAHDDDVAEVFTFETTSTSVVGSFSVNYPPVSGVMHSSIEDTSKPTSSGMMRSPYENVMIPAPGTVLHPQSPRTRIRTIAPSVKDTNESVEIRQTANSDYEFMESLSSSRKQENGFVLDAKKSLNDGGGKFILPLENDSPESLNDAVSSIVISKQPADVPDSKINGSVSEKNTIPADSTSDASQQLRQKNAGELELVRRERGKLLATMSGLKRKVADIELQQEEILRELDMERALLEGEWQAQRDKLLQEEERLSALREKVAGLDLEMEEQRHREQQRQNEAKWRLERAEREVYRLEQELSAYSGNSDKQSELSESLKQQLELLEAERKAFEDLEFRQLEEEAGWLAGNEELQRELVELTARVEVRNMRLSELEHQRGEAARVAQEENRSMQRQLITYLHRLEEGRQRLKILDSQLSELTSGQTEPGQDSSQDGSSDNDEVIRSTSLQQSSSQDDLDRISRVTSGAPMEMSSGTLGRRTLESLQEIERNRQRHLVQQGSQVIEEERKRVQELKRRVQDEVRAQWEERRQREANCNSLNSVGSEDSSLTSSDIPTESASSDDALLSPNKSDVTARSDTTENKTESVPDNDSNVQDKSKMSMWMNYLKVGYKKRHRQRRVSSSSLEMREKELAAERDREETRPLSDGSAYEHQLSAPVRKRDKCSPRPQEPSQRPLTRYLPIRSESLNLRQHVESAGHQVELCKDVSLDATSCRGHLHKMGSKFHHWNKRWFVFDRVRRTLTYYSDRGEKKPRGGAYFQSIEEVYVDHLNSVKSPNPQLTFVVKTNERTYHLMAPSPEAMRIWVDVIFTGAEGYQEFEHGS